MGVQFNLNCKKVTLIVPDLEPVESKAAYHQGKHLFKYRHSGLLCLFPTDKLQACMFQTTIWMSVLKYFQLEKNNWLAAFRSC